MDQDGEMIAQVILPQMNVSRRMANGLVNPYEKVNTQVIYATSAGMKSSFAYEALLDTFEKSIIEPKSNFTIGLDYRIPVMHGLIDGNYVRDLKMSPSYNESTFASEYMGTWLGGSDESWFQFDQLTKHRKIKNPEWYPKFENQPNVFYLLSVDVGRLNDATVVMVWRVNILQNRYYCTLVNVIVLGRNAVSKQFSLQARDIKKLIKLYNPREVVIDTNGLGIGLADEMIQSQLDDDGSELPPYGFFNNADYKKIQPPNARQILYSLKANSTLNSQIHANAYTRINNGSVRFLITEQEARSLLLSTKVGQKMTTEERIRRLLPHELTTKLFEEMANLRLRRVGTDISLEQINPRFPKDKFSACEYGLWRIKELEEADFKKFHRNRGETRQLIFFTGGK